MKTLLLTGAAALAALTAPLAAQDTVAVDAAGNVYVLTPEQEAMVVSWPADRQSVYRAWPYNLQEYYWTLAEPRQAGWWLLTDDQRGQVYAMTPEQREAAWASIVAQANADMTASAAVAASATAATAAPRFVAREVVQSTPAATTANVAAADLPVCKPGQQDGCINGWEKNRTGNRPLESWPGKPASEM